MATADTGRLVDDSSTIAISRGMRCLLDAEAMGKVRRCSIITIEDCTTTLALLENVNDKAKLILELFRVEDDSSYLAGRRRAGPKRWNGCHHADAPCQVKEGGPWAHDTASAGASDWAIVDRVSLTHAWWRKRRELGVCWRWAGRREPAPSVQKPHFLRALVLYFCWQWAGRGK